MKKNNPCPCGSGKIYSDCCEIAHLDLSKVETAEQLMRSRYTAFTMADGDYLMKSHHSETCPYLEKEAIVNWAKSVLWLKLDVLKSTKDIVEFKAYYLENGKQNYIHEKSKFIKEDGCWVYYDAL